MTVKLLPSAAKLIEDKASRYGCGAWDCLSCYPIQYACDECADTFEQPILRTRPEYVFVCEECEFLEGYEGVRVIR